MTNRRIATVGLWLLAIVLWVPAGQQVFLLEHWMKVGTIAAPLLLLVGGMLAANWFQWVPQWLWFATLVAWGLMPAVLFAGRRPTPVGAPRTAHA